MIFKITVAFFLAVILIIMFIIMLRKDKRDHNIKPIDQGEIYRDCPLCGTSLRRGETVHSHLYPGKPDGMMHIFGCPYCYSGHPRVKEQKDISRICPYCRKEIPEKGYVIARVFEKPGKTHVHVLGCTLCRKKS